MARLWSGGAELQTVTSGIEFTATITNAPVVETTIKRSGNAAWRISNAATAEGFRQIHTAAQGAFFFRFYLYIVAMPTNAAMPIGGSRQTGANKAVIRLTSGGVLQLYNIEDSAQVGSDSSALSTATWYRVEIAYDSTTLNATTCEARLYAASDEATLLWNPSGTIDITATPNSFGCFTTGGDATLDYVVDDLAINDTSGTSPEVSWCGEGEVIVLRPNGNGDNSAWTGSDADSTDNYLLVDEVPPSGTDYVESNTSGQIDDYNLEATPAAMESSDTINVVHVGVYAAVSDATGADPDIVLRIKASASGTVEESASLDLNSVTFQGPAPLPADSNYKLTLYDLPGASTTPWTKADLDVAQAGVREAVTDTHFARVGALWVMVDHKPGAGGTEYEQDVSGAITPAGVLTKLTSKSPSGIVLSIVGTVTKQTSKTFAGALSSIVGVLNKLTSKSFEGEVTSAGVLETIKSVLLSLSGAITPAGTLIKSVAKSFTGSITPSGTLSKLISKFFTGTATSAGSVTKQTSKSASGSVATSGAVTKESGKALTGTVSSSGSLVRSVGKTLAGAVVVSGAVTKAVSKAMSGVLSGSGSLTKSMSKSVSGAVASVGSLATVFIAGVATTVAASVKHIFQSGGRTNHTTAGRSVHTTDDHTEVEN